MSLQCAMLVTTRKATSAFCVTEMKSNPHPVTTNIVGVLAMGRRMFQMLDILLAVSLLILFNMLF